MLAMLEFNPEVDFWLLLAVPLIPLCGYVLQISLRDKLPGGDKILTAGMGDLVQEGLDDKSIGRVRRGAPGSARHANIIVKIFQAEVVDKSSGKVVAVEFCLPQVLVRHIRAPVILAGACQALGPGNKSVVFVQARADLVQSGRTEKVVPDVVLSCPLQLDWPTSLLGNQCRFGHVVIRKTAPKAAAYSRHVNTDVFPW